MVTKSPPPALVLDRSGARRRTGSRRGHLLPRTHCEHWWPEARGHPWPPGPVIEIRAGYGAVSGGRCCRWQLPPPLLPGAPREASMQGLGTQSMETVVASRSQGKSELRPRDLLRFPSEPPVSMGPNGPGRHCQPCPSAGLLDRARWPEQALEGHHGQRPHGQRPGLRDPLARSWLY